MTENEQRLLARVAPEARNTRPWGWTSFPAPADESTVTRAETALGFSLPPLLAALYSRVGDGGFGPEYGLLPLLDNPPAGEPAAVTPQATVLLHEPNADEADHAWYVDAPSLAEWLQGWLDGTGWYAEANIGIEPEPWADFRIRTTAQAS
jgi:hypothetical protein